MHALTYLLAQLGKEYDADVEALLDDLGTVWYNAAGKPMSLTALARGGWLSGSSVPKRATAAGELSEEEQSELSLSFGRLSSKPMPKDWPTPDPRHPRMLLEDFDPEVGPCLPVEHLTTACVLQKAHTGSSHAWGTGRGPERCSSVLSH